MKNTKLKAFIGLKDVVLSIVADYWLTIREPEIFMENVEHRLISSRISNPAVIVLKKAQNN
jgi:hypothetical protein